MIRGEVTLSAMYVDQMMITHEFNSIANKYRVQPTMHPVAHDLQHAIVGMEGPRIFQKIFGTDLRTGIPRKRFFNRIDLIEWFEWRHYGCMRRSSYYKEIGEYFYHRGMNGCWPTR